LITGVTFEIGEEIHENSSPQGLSNSADQIAPTWECVWKQKTATATVHMAFSADGTLFATAGRADRLVKIWFEQKPREYWIYKTAFLSLTVLTGSLEVVKNCRVYFPQFEEISDQNFQNCGIIRDILKKT